MVTKKFDRLPRKLLSCWVFNQRLRGSPEFTYGRGVYKALKWFDIEKESWFDLIMVVVNGEI